MKRERIFYLDFIRALSAVLIVIFHFNEALRIYSVSSKQIIPSKYANGDIGIIGVSLFFIVSGAALMHNYKKNFSLKIFLKKRFMGLYPMFWITWCISFICLFYINKGVRMHSPLSIILTIFGFDGYMLYKIPNFYLIGEWFLGCIILLYLCFPILRYLMIKKPKILLILTFIIYLIAVQKYNCKMPISRNFTMRIPDFLLGMYFVKYIKKVKAYQLFLCVITTFIMLFVKININQMYKTTLIGIVIFFILVYISSFMKLETIRNQCKIISKYSYAIFLVHHITINCMMLRFKGTSLQSIETDCLFILTAIIIGIISVYLFKLTNSICNYFINITEEIKNKYIMKNINN